MKLNANIEDAKKLYWKYMCITYEDLVNEETKLKQLYKGSHGIIERRLVLRNITGFGSQYSCMLCKRSCEECIYYGVTDQGCSHGANRKTYNAIHEANDLQQLLSAIKDRAHWLAEVIVMAERGIHYDADINR